MRIIALPVPAEHLQRYYKISVDVKDGFTWDEGKMVGDYYAH